MSAPEPAPQRPGSTRDDENVDEQITWSMNRLDINPPHVERSAQAISFRPQWHYDSPPIPQHSFDTLSIGSQSTSMMPTPYYDPSPSHAMYGQNMYPSSATTSFSRSALSPCPTSTTTTYNFVRGIAFPNDEYQLSSHAYQSAFQLQPRTFPTYGQYMGPYIDHATYPRYPGSLPYTSHGSFSSMQAQYGGFSSFPRNVNETATPVAASRGPPRKPKQSGHALWVGNLPADATVGELKDHFSQGLTKEIESLFLISKSNCAFVNYRTEAACVAALQRFHESNFRGVRVVCRLRRGTSETPIVPLPGSDDLTSLLDAETNNFADQAQAQPANSIPVIVGSINALQEESSTEHTTGQQASASPDRFFIVKSLTIQDLEASVREGTWATQAHNEEIFNQAFDQAENVYLVFSVNKSGEYFGYARMMTKISGEPVATNVYHEVVSRQADGGLRTISTPATVTAPRGHIIDDSARGTIFWEAELSDHEAESELASGQTDATNNLNTGRQFKVQWLSTTKLPFFRTRGLRNSYNANREVKIARDGTELEPALGQHLVSMFHGPVPSAKSPRR